MDQLTQAPERNKTIRQMKRIAFILASIVLIGCKENTARKEFLGMVNLEVTGNSEAVAQFERGLLLLHSFEYYDAREAFRNAREIDPQIAGGHFSEGAAAAFPAVLPGIFECLPDHW